MHRCVDLRCVFAVGVREVVDLHAQIFDVRLCATAVVSVDATTFVFLSSYCHRLPTRSLTCNWRNAGVRIVIIPVTSRVASLERNRYEN